MSEYKHKEYKHKEYKDNISIQNITLVCPSMYIPREAIERPATPRHRTIKTVMSQMVVTGPVQPVLNSVYSRCHRPQTTSIPALKYSPFQAGFPLWHTP